MPARNVTEIHADGRARFRFSWTGDDGETHTRTSKDRRALERERRKLVGDGAPLEMPPPPAQQPGSARWWHAHMIEAATLARAALARQDTTALGAIKKYAATLDACSRAAVPHQGREQTERALEETLQYVEGTLRALGYSSPEFDKAAAGYQLILDGKAALAGIDEEEGDDAPGDDHDHG